MSVPYNDDTRQTYVERQAANHLHAAEVHYKLGSDHAMWTQLLTWAQAEELYGTHWDKLKEKT